MASPQPEPAFLAKYAAPRAPRPLISPPSHSLTRALKALVKFAFDGAAEEASVAAKLVRDMVKGLETAATAEMEEQRQAVLLATRELILRMRSVLDDPEGERQRELLLAAQELKRCACDLFYLVTPDAAASPAPAASDSPSPSSDASPVPRTHSAPVPVLQLPGSAAGSLAGSPIVTSSSSPAVSIKLETPTRDHDAILDEANELLQDLGSARPLVSIAAASDRAWVTMPPLDEGRLAGWSGFVPTGTPPVIGVRSAADRA